MTDLGANGPPTPRNDTYVVFEGGGAMGVAHVGVLRALQDRPGDYHLCGFAGASAGALVALLAAAGFTGREIIGDLEVKKDAEKGAEADAETSAETQRLPTILDRLTKDILRGEPEVRTAPELIGGGWRWIRLFRNMTDFPKAPDNASPWERRWRAVRNRLWSLVLPGIVMATFLASLGLVTLLYEYAPLCLPAWLSSVIASLFPLSRPVLVGALALSVLGVVAVRVLRGLASLGKAHRLLRRVVAEKLNEKGGPKFDGDRPITFERFEEATGTKLKIVASNLTYRRMHLFSNETSKTACVVDAAIASMCIPVIFKPRRVGWADPDGTPRQRELFADGGLVSNLPAWSFEPELKLNRRALIVMSALGGTAQKDPETPRRGRFSHLRALVRTAVFGGGELNVRGMPNLIRIAPKVDLIKVLDVDATKETVADVVHSAHEVALLKLDSERARHAMVAAIRAFAIEKARELKLDVENRYIRAAIAMRAEFANAPLSYFQLRYGKGFECHADEGAEYPYAGSAAALAMNSGQPQRVDLSNPAVRKVFRGISVDDWAERLTPQDLAWSICVPAGLKTGSEEDASIPIAITIDGNVPLGDAFEHFADAIETYILSTNFGNG